MKQFQSPVPILMYHSVSDGASPEFDHVATSVDRFTRQMAAIEAEGYTPVTVAAFRRAQLEGAQGLPAKPIVITFDDGFEDTASVALPILQRHGFVATVYITTAYVGGTSRYLEPELERSHPMVSQAQILEIEQAGMEIGAHGHTHRPLDELSLQEAREEISLSKSLLETWLGHPIESFAYPYGVYSSTTRRLVEQAGYSSACAVKNGLSTIAEDYLAYSRVTMGGDLVVDRNTLQNWSRGVGLRVAPRESVRWQVRRGAKRLAARLGGRGSRPAEESPAMFGHLTPHHEAASSRMPAPRVLE